MQSAPTLTKIDADMFSDSEREVLDAMAVELRARDRAPAGTLALRLDTSPVRVREVISSLRLKGVLIGSDGKGFYMPANRAEAEQTSQHLWSRVRAIAKVARAYDVARGEHFNQTYTVAEQIGLVFGEAS